MQRAWRRNWEKNKKYQQALVKKVAGPLVATGLAFGIMTSAYANPTGGTITSGLGFINDNGSIVEINQNTDKLAINWDTFSIGNGELVNFNQPTSQSIALNRVIGSEASNIYGTLTANGKVFLINPNGVLFAPGASVNVGGLVAATSNISDQDFQNGMYAFVGGQGGNIINGGSITATGGNVELLGSVVSNQGVIAATGISTDGTMGVVRLVGNSVELNAGSQVNADSNAILRAGADGTGVGTVTLAAGALTTPKATVYYNPIAYNDNATKSDSVGNPYSSLLPGSDVTAYMLVNTAADLQKINSNMYGTYALNNDLDMANVNYVPIGDGIGAFRGIFNGDNNTISNLTINSNARNVGLFADTNNAVIHDLSLADVNITATAGGDRTYTGGLVGKAVQSTISNISVSGNVQGNTDYVAGVVGRSQGSTVTKAYNSADVTSLDNSGRLRHAAGVVGLNDHGANLDQSVNTGKITNNNSEGYAAGLAAYNYNGAIVQNSRNEGEITGGDSTSYVGGLVGSNWGDTVAQGSVILNSVNNGLVNGGTDSNIGGVAGGMKNSSIIQGSNTNKVSGDGKWVGGLVGVDYGYSLIDLSANYGAVIASGENADVGGLIGYQKNSKLTNSENFGEVTGSANGNTGGLVGYQVEGTVSHSSNHGNVTDTLGASPGSPDTKVRFDSRYELSNSDYLNAVIEGTTTEIKKNVGGIVGKSVSGQIENVSNEGNVTAANSFSNAGGIVGWAHGVTVEYADNSSKVASGDSSNVGGIVGYNGNASNLYSVANSGDIGHPTANANDQSNMGGIAGWNSASHITEANNDGNINGGNAWHVGGIAGNSSQEYAGTLEVSPSIRNVSNSGNVTVSADRSYAGGIAGASSGGFIEYAHNSGAVTNNGDIAFAGGIAGTNWQNSEINQTVNTGAVTSTGIASNTGGIAGGNGNEPGSSSYIRPSNIKNSINQGTVTGGYGIYSQTGGIVGFNRGGTVDNCSNTGLIIESFNIGAGQVISGNGFYYNINTADWADAIDNTAFTFDV